MIIKTSKDTFHFKQFSILQDQCTMKVGTDGVLLGAWGEASGAKKILDIGTGTGVIAIMMAQRNENAQIDAVEIDESAWSQAAQNCSAAPWSDRLQVFHTAIQDFAKTSTEKYDLIVSNPPFFTGGTFSSSEKRSSVRHTVKLPTGDLLNAARNLLSEDGKLCVILPTLEGMRFQERAQQYRLYCTKKTEVKPKQDKPVERLLLQFERKPNSLVTDKLVIQYDARNDYTEDYIKLTKAFYLKM